MKLEYNFVQGAMMKQLLLLSFLFLYTLFGADFSNVQTFQADFIQKVTDDKGKELIYKGHIQAAQPQFALWSYTSPVEKNIYISMNQLTIVEPELEQVIVRHIASEFNFFKMIRKAKKIDAMHASTTINNTTYTIISTKEQLLHAITYKDELDNTITIEFFNESINKSVDPKVFIPKYPPDYDLIRG